MSDIPIYKFALIESLKNETIFLPSRSEPYASGWDVRAASRLVISPYEYAKIHLGFRAFCPEGWWLELKPRSSSFTKKRLHALYGTIDQTYEGDMIFACQYIPPFEYKRTPGSYSGDKHYLDLQYATLTIERGEAIGQLIPIKRQEMIVENISNEEFDQLCLNRNAQRGAGGFGSTDKKVKV